MNKKLLLCSTLVLLVSTSLASCSNSSSGKKVSRDEFLNAYEEISIKRGEISSYNFSNVTYLENDVEKNKNQLTLLNFDSGFLYAYINGYELVPIGASNKAYLDLLIRDIIGENKDEEVYTINNGLLSFSLKGKFNFDGINYDGSFNASFDSLGLLNKSEINAKINETNYHSIIEMNNYQKVNKIDQQTMINKYQEAMNKRKNENISYQEASCSGFYSLDNSEDVIFDKKLSVIDSIYSSSFDFQLSPLATLLTSFNDINAFTAFISNFNNDYVFSFSGNNLYIYFTSGEGSEKKESICVYNEYGFITHLYSYGFSLKHNFKISLFVKNYVAGNKIDNLENYLTKYLELINARGDKVNPHIATGISYKEEFDGSKMKYDFIPNTFLLNKKYYLEDGQSYSIYHIEMLKKFSFNCPFIHDTTKTLSNFIENITETFDASSLVKKYYYTNDSLFLYYYGNSIDSNKERIEINLVFNELGYMKSFDYLCYGEDGGVTLRSEIFISRYVLDNKLNDKNSIIEAYQNAINNRYKPINNAIYFYWDSRNYEEIYSGRSRLVKNENGVYDTEILINYGFYLGYNNISSFREFYEAIVASDPDCTCYLSEFGGLYLRFKSLKISTERISLYFSPLGYVQNLLAEERIDSDESYFTYSYAFSLYF